MAHMVVSPVHVIFTILLLPVSLFDRNIVLTYYLFPISQCEANIKAIQHFLWMFHIKGLPEKAVIVPFMSL